MTAVDVWRRPDLLDALRAGDFGALLRAYRKWTGCSQSSVGARCGLSQPDVSEMENGRRKVTSAAVRQRVLDGLGVPAGLRPLAAGSLALPTMAPSPDADTADRLTSAVESDRLDRPVLDYMAVMLAEHRRIEDRLGARVLLPVVAAQAVILERLTRAAPQQLHDDALALMSQYSQFLAWMRHDQRDDRAALALFSAAESQAQEAGDASMAATVLSMKAHLAWGAGDPLACVRFAEAAQWASPKITPGACGMAAQMQARGLAVLKDADGADRAVDRARALLGEAAEHWEDEPSWLYFYQGPWIELQVGALQLDLGRAGRSIDLLTRALAELDPGYVRDGAWYRAILSRALLEAGDAEHAAATALAVLPDARETNLYALDHVKGTALRLARRAGSLEPVRALAEQLRAA